MNSTTRWSKSLVLFIGAFVFTLNTAPAATSTWSGVAGDKLWSTPSNWSPAKPTSADDVIFNDTDTTGTSGTAGTSNNIVDAGFANSIKSLRYANTSGFHNTRLTNNLVINGSGAVDSLFVGTGVAGPNLNQTVYATITGKGVGLALTNTSGFLRVVQGTNNTGGANSSKATLDLSGLDTFTARLSAYYIAYSANSTDEAYWNRPCGTVLLARTNTITCSTHLLSEAFSNGGAASTERMGQVNTFNVDTFKVASRKGSGTLNFNTGLSSPTVKFRNTAGTGRATWYIGDDNGATGSSASTGTMDLTGGTVDAMVDIIYVGRGMAFADSSNTGDGNGTLTFNGGTIDVNTLNVGYQLGTGTAGGASTGRGTLNVNGTALLKVNGDMVLARQLPGSTDVPTATVNITSGTNTIAGNLVDGGGTATVNINNGRMTVAGNVSDGGSAATITITNNGTMTVAGNFSRTNGTLKLVAGGTLNLQPAGDLVAGDITVNTLNIGSASLTNFGTLGVSNINPTNPATAFTLYPGQTLAPVAVGIPGTLTVNGGLILTSAVVKMDIGSSSDQIAVTGTLELDGATTVLINPVSGFSAGSYPVMTYGTLIGDVTNNITVGGAIANSRYVFTFDTNTPNTIMLNVSGTGPSTLTWSGDGSGNAWDINSTTNWDAGLGPRTEKFYNLDTVTFDDVGSASPAANLTGILIPTSVTVNGTNSYTFTGSGKISGFTGLTDNSSGTLTVLTTNDYTGTTVINSGATLQAGNGTTATGALGAGEIQNYGTLVFNPAGAQNIGSVVSGYGALTKTGPGTTVFAGVNTFSSQVTIQGGTLLAGTASAFGDTSQGTVITSGGTLDVGGFNLGNEAISVSGAGVNGTGAIINSGATQGNALNNVTMTGDAVFGGPNRWDLSGLSSTSTEPGLNAQGYNLTKVGGNQISITSYNANWHWNTALGNIDAQGGIISIQCYVSLGDNTKTLTIRSNAAVEFCHNGAMVMDKPISMTNGCIQARFFSSSYPNYTDLSGPITLNGSNVFDVFATTMSLQVDGSIGGSGTLIKGIGHHTEGGNTSTGVGTLILTVSNSFTGDLQIQTGTLILTNTASVTKAANIVLAGGTLDASKRTDLTLTLATAQTLKGNGTIIGTVTSPAGTTVSPGATTTAATLNITGPVNLAGATVMDITKTNATKAADKLAATGIMDLGGALTVNFAGNTNLAAGDKFTLFSSSSFTHSFTSTNLPTLLSGLAWSNSVASGNWNIEVIATEPVTPPVLMNILSSNNLTLSWDTAYTSYILEGQTNTSSVGLVTNSASWSPVPGVSGNQITIAINPTNASVFFRLKK